VAYALEPRRFASDPTPEAPVDHSVVAFGEAILTLGAPVTDQIAIRVGVR